MSHATKLEPTSTSGLTGPQLREKELAIFRQRVKVYNLKLTAANRGLINKFTMADV